MSSTEQEQSSTWPFLVKIQSINLQSLDFKTGIGTGRSKTITFIEVSNRFLLIGCLSGTVFVFTRDSLDFKFMIPFKGGRVCNMAFAEDECDLAIGSTRGKVSLYRIYSFNETTLENNANSHLSFKHLHSVNLHADNEITEMRWSSNGRFLFIGDSKGLVSQINIGSLEEFPRPRLPSKVILEVKEGIVEMNCAFPYLAVVTNSEAFLCDIENEDFTRIKIKDGSACPSGISLLASSQQLSLYVSELNQGRLYQCDLQGQVINSARLSFNTKSNQKPQKLFDPTNLSAQVKDLTEDTANIKLRLCKLGVTEEGFLISTSTNPRELRDKLLIINPINMEIVGWSEEFEKIHSVKIILNYLFIWHGDKVEVLALTSFKSYAQQLFRAGLTNILEGWVKHTLNIIGVQGKDVEKKTQFVFRQMVGKECEFHSFISKLISFPLVEPSTLNPLPQALSNLCLSLQNLTLQNDPILTQVVNWIKSLKCFYTELETSLPSFNSDQEMNLMRIIAAAKTFLHQPQLVTLKEDLSKKYLKFGMKLEEFVSAAILKLINFEPINSVEETSSDLFFSSFASHPIVLGWFADLGLTKEEINFDGIFADFLLLVAPILIISQKNISPQYYFSWLVRSHLHSDTDFPLKSHFPTLLTEISSSTSKRNPHDEFFSKVALYILGSRDEKKIEELSGCLHHFLSTIYLMIWEPKSGEGFFLTFFSSFPVHHLSNEDLRDKFGLLCRNPILLRLFRKAALEQSTVLELCKCNLPKSYAPMKTIPLYQKAIDQVLLNSFTPNESREALGFALQRSNFKFVLDQGLLKLEEEAEMILRTSSCHLLSHWGFTNEKFKLVLEIRNQFVGNINLDEKIAECRRCREKLVISPLFQIFSMDCLGAWAFHFNSLDNLEFLVQKLSMNQPGIFSLRFYQLVSRDKDKKNKRLYKEEISSVVELDTTKSSQMVSFCTQLHKSHTNHLSSILDESL